MLLKTMTTQNPNDPPKPNNDGSDTDSDSDDDNVNIVIDETPKHKPNNENKNNEINKSKPNHKNKLKDTNKKIEENIKEIKRREVELERKKKRKHRFIEEERKHKNRKKTPVRKPPIVINLFDLLNPESDGWMPVNYDEPPPPPKNEENMQIEDDILSEPLETHYLDMSLENIDDLITIGNDYLNGKYSPLIKYNINVYTISKLLKPLQKLKNMIGMENIKRDIFELLLYQLQEFDNSKDMLHTIIEGEPGVGKTDLAKIIANIYQEMGYCLNKIVKFVKRSDLIGGYLGQTAIKTQKVLDECKGGVLVIDEAYSLGSPEGRDSYSKECIDTLTSFLSESPETIVFIMGYADDLEKSLFSQNKGLERRFSYRFTVNKYKPDELRKILFKIIKENGWDIEQEEEIPECFFEKNIDFFPFNGGDMLNLFTKCKFTHSIRFYNMNKKSTSEKNFENLKKKINYEDIKNAFRLLKKDEKFKNRKEINDVKNVGMYS